MGYGSCYSHATDESRRVVAQRDPVPWRGDRRPGRTRAVIVRRGRNHCDDAVARDLPEADVRREADGKGLHPQHLAGGLRYLQ